MQRYFVKKEKNKLILNESDLHHIKNVMRIKSDDKIICILNNQSYLCKINYDETTYDIKIIEEISKDVELPKEIILYQALIKNDKFDFVIQKASELGVSKIVPTIFSRSIIKITENKKDNKIIRYQKIAKEACEQSHRQIIPEISNYLDVKNITLDNDTLGLIAYENNGDYLSFYKNLMNLQSYLKIALVIGPEGGFSEDELNYLKGIGFKSISLGKRILRSETASLYALSVLAYNLEGRD